MIQLEHGVKIDDKQYVMVMTDEEADELCTHLSDYPNLKAIYISKNVLLTSKQSEWLKGVKTHIIPDNYFMFELKEEAHI
jgi:adenine-specific DNA-methyltransferase